MGEFLPKTVLDRLSRMDFLASNSSVKCGLLRSYCQNIDTMLTSVKALLELVCENEVLPDEELSRCLKELDVAVRDAWQLIESWHHARSKIFFVSQMDIIVSTIQASILSICELLNSLSTSLTACACSCIEKLQEIHFEDISETIEVAAKEYSVKNVLDSKILAKVSASLCLSTNLELYMEVVALETLRTKFYSGETRKMEHIELIAILLNFMHDNLASEKQLNSINGVSIPTDFCCPLSLELMSDPVIVASGQTYEKAFIRVWLDEGFTVCPKTRQKLSHTNLIPNYTVKALVANWCELHAIMLPDPVKSLRSIFPFVSFAAPDSGISGGSPLHGGHSPRNAFLGSPESSPYANNLQRDSPLHGAYQTSPSHGNAVQTYPQGMQTQSSAGVISETDVSRLPLAASGVREASTSGEMLVSSLQTSDQNGAEMFQASNMDMQHSNPKGASSIGGSQMALASDGLRNDIHVASEAKQDGQAAVASLKGSEYLPRMTDIRPRNQFVWRQSSDRTTPRIVSSPSMESRPDLSAVENQVRNLVEDLRNDSVDVQRAATAELRLLAKNTVENRIIIANCGAIGLLVGLLYSADLKTQENAVTTLLNLSINDNNKVSIAHANAIDPLIHVLETGNSEAKENAAATLYSLSVIEENKLKVGRSGAIKPLVELLKNGTPRGKKDASTALFNLSILHENKIRIVQAGAVKHLVELMDPAAGMVDKAVAVLANLSTIPDGRTAIGNAGGIPGLVEVVELGSTRGKENAAAALLQLCTNSSRFCSIVLQEGAVPPLVALSQSGTPRAKEKAQALLTYFRNQRHGNSGRR